MGAGRREGSWERGEAARGRKGWGKLQLLGKLRQVSGSSGKKRQKERSHGGAKGRRRESRNSMGRMISKGVRFSWTSLLVPHL